MNRLQDQFKIWDSRELPPHTYLIERLSAQSLPDVHRIDRPSQLLSFAGKYHHLVCGDVGYVSEGNMILWLLHTDGPLIDFLRQVTGKATAVSLVGFVLLTQTGKPRSKGALKEKPASLSTMWICCALRQHIENSSMVGDYGKPQSTS